MEPYVSKEALEAGLRDVDKIADNLKLHSSFKSADRINRSAVLLLDAAFERDVRHRYDSSSLPFYLWFVDPTWRMFVFVVAFSYMMLLPFFEAPCRPWNSTLAVDTTTCPTEIWAMLVEVLFILPLLWCDCGLRFRATGQEAFFSLKWNIAMVLSLLVCTVDVIGAHTLPTSQWSHPRVLRLFRGILAMASSKHSREATGDNVEVFFHMIPYVVGTVIFTTIWAAIGLAMFGNMGQRVSVDWFENSYDTFNTMLTLMTANNWPDVQLPYYRLSQANIIYFDVVVIISFYGFINGIIPGLVASVYHGCEAQEARSNVVLERNILLLVFGGVQEDADTTLSKEELMNVYVELARIHHMAKWWQRLLDRIKPSRRPASEVSQAGITASAARIYAEIDKDGSGVVEVKEFVDYARDATDQEVLRGFQAPQKDPEMSSPMRIQIAGICSSTSFKLGSLFLCVASIAVQFQILEFLLALEAPFAGQFRSFWYTDWLLLALSLAEAGISRLSRPRMNKAEYALIFIAIFGKVVAELMIRGTLFMSSYHNDVPLYPLFRENGRAFMFRMCCALRFVGVFQIFGINTTSLETLALFSSVSRDLSRLIGCILALTFVFSQVGMYCFLGGFSSDNPAFAGGDYDSAGYYDFVHFDSWLAALNTVLIITVDNNWNVVADGAATTYGWNSAWIYFTLIYFVFHSVVLNIFLCMFMDLYGAVEKEKRRGGAPVLSSMSVTHRMFREDVRKEMGIED